MKEHVADVTQNHGKTPVLIMEMVFVLLSNNDMVMRTGIDHVIRVCLLNNVNIYEKEKKCLLNIQMEATYA